MATTSNIAGADGMVIQDYLKAQADKKEKSLYVDRNDNAVMDKDDFLNLLVTQLRYQDPLQPSDNQEMAAQMAQFSSLEQTKNMADSLNSMTTSIQDMVEKQGAVSMSMSSSSATSLMGKTVRLRQSEAVLGVSGKPVPLNITGKSGSELAILDQDGRLVRSLPLDGQTSNGKNILDANGDGKIVWDGRSDAGKVVAPGAYQVVVRDTATGQETGSVWTDAVVSGIGFDTDGPRLITGSGSFRMEDLMSVASTSSVAPASAASGSATPSSTTSASSASSTASSSTTTSTSTTSNTSLGS